MTPDPAHPDAQTQAAELALGLLDGDERSAALRRMLADPDFAQQVAWWREQFSGLLDEYRPETPPPHLLPPVDTGPATSPPAAAPPRSPRGWRWFVGGAASGALAASLLAAVVLQRAPPAAPPAPVPASAARPATPMIAVLIPSPGGDQAPVAAWLTRDGGSLRLTAAIPVPQGQSAELWSIGADKVPRPLGLLAPNGRSSTIAAQADALKSGDTLAISIEPQGGSPSGAPTGPVIASGVMVMA